MICIFTCICFIFYYYYYYCCYIIFGAEVAILCSCYVTLYLEVPDAFTPDNKKANQDGCVHYLSISYRVTDLDLMRNVKPKQGYNTG